MIALSASKTALVLACGYFARPEVVRMDVGPKRAAAIGLATHDACEAIQNRQPVDLDAIANARGLDEKERAKLPFLVDALDGHFIPGDAVAEQTYAYNWRTGEARVLGRSLDRKYIEAGLADDEIPGTADLVWFEDDGATVVIPDLKSGFHDELDDHEEQLLWLAMAAVKAHGAKRARIMTLPLGDDSKPADPRTVEDFELEAFEETYRARVMYIAEGDPQPEPGDHCKDQWCPAIGSCPRATSEALRLLPAHAIVPRFRLSGPIAGEEEAAYRLNLLPMLKAAVKAIEQGLKEYADEHGPIETPDGPWGPIVSETTTLVPNALVEDILERELGARAVDLAIEREITQASIKRAVQALGMKPVQPAVDRVVKAIKEAGATKTGTRTTYDIVKIGKGRAA